MVKQISDNEICLLIKYIKSILWRVAKRLSYTEDAWCLKVKNKTGNLFASKRTNWIWPMANILQVETKSETHRKR